MSKREQFGRVYVCNSEGGYDLIPSATFSNLDFRWYDPMGEIHSQFQKHAGKRFTLGFKIFNTDSAGEKRPFESRLHFPLRLGENRAPDLDYFDKLLQREHEVAKEVGVISGDDDPARAFLDESESSGLCLFRAPGEEVMKYRLLILFSLGACMDTILNVQKNDAVAMLKQQNYERSFQLHKISTGFLAGKAFRIKDVIKIFTSGEDGEENEEEDDSMGSLVGLMKWARVSMKVMWDTRSEVRKLGTEEETAPFLTAFMNIAEANMFIMCKEWQRQINDESKIDTLLPIQIELITRSMGGVAQVELMALLEGIKLTGVSREKYILQTYLAQMATVVGKIHSLFSYEKGLETGNNERNEVSLLSNVLKLPLNAALEKVLKDLNAAMDTMVELEQSVLTVKGDDEGVERYARLVLEHVGSVIQWFGLTRRFKHKIVFDCYVEE